MIYLLSFLGVSVFLATLLFTILVTIWDSKQLRTRENNEWLVSFLIPTYNDAIYFENSIKSIYDSYKGKSEIFVINDCSTDNTVNILDKLSKKYKIHVHNNGINTGKAGSVNKIFNSTKGEIIFVLDSDTSLSKDNIDDVLKRFEHNRNLGAVSCRYFGVDKGFLASMQNLEYNMFSLIQGAYNLSSTPSLWGGCMAFRRQAFIDAGMLSENAIVEDMDIALKLRKCGWKVEQSYVQVKTHIPTDLKCWFKQKVRWTSGCIQCLLNYPGIYLKNPISVIFLLSYSLLTLLFVLSITRYVLFDEKLLPTLLINLSYSLFSVPYVIMYMKNVKKFYQFFLIIPYTLLYFPIFILVSLYGFYVGIKNYRLLKNGARAW